LRKKKPKKKTTTQNHTAEMQSLTSAASIKPTTVEKLEKLKEFYVILYKNKGEVVSPKSAEKVMALLLSVVSERTTEKSLQRDLTPVAKKALELFFYFLTQGILCFLLFLSFFFFFY
jgi:hypothetical protein